jgi:pilus assembly protein CpaB
MKKSTIALFFAVALAVLAVIAVRKYLVQKEKEIEQATDTVKVLIANEVIEPGDKLAENQVETREIPERMLLPEMILLSEKRQYLGQRAVKRILRGATLLEQYFRTEEGIERTMTVVRGKRIATINVNPVTGIAGLITPGDHVDVMITFRGQGGASGGGRTQTLFHDVTVFATDDVTRIGYRRNRSRSVQNQYATVTLLLFPQEVELLVYAMSNGEISLAKRSSTDPDIPKLTGVDPSTFQSLVDEAQGLRGGGK